MYKLHTYCRACGYAKPGAQGIKAEPSQKLIEVFDLGVQPLANDFCKDGSEHSGMAPLKVMFCPRCSLAQLSVVVDPAILYRYYNYVTSTSDIMQAHFQQLISDIKNETDRKTVLEIGSNDGRMLMTMRDHGYSVNGVDPAENLARVAKQNGIATTVGLFDSDLARTLPQFDIIIARHVFCHVDNWHDFIAGLDWVSHKETLICIEVPYVGNTLKHVEFDQIYHEHLSYMSLKAMAMLLKPFPLRICKVREYPIHGGTVLIMIRHKDSVKIENGEFADEITVGDWDIFNREAKSQIAKLQLTVQDIVKAGYRVAGLGASAKSTVWINACGFSRKEIKFITDNTPQKQWTTSPGSDIPIVDEGAILRELPEYVIMFAWNYRDEILKKFSLARSKGVKFIVPVKPIEIV